MGAIWKHIWWYGREAKLQILSLIRYLANTVVCCKNCVRKGNTITNCEECHLFVSNSSGSYPNQMSPFAIEKKSMIPFVRPYSAEMPHAQKKKFRSPPPSSHQLKPDEVWWAVYGRLGPKTQALAHNTTKELGKWKGAGSLNSDTIYFIAQSHF